MSIRLTWVLRFVPREWTADDKRFTADVTATLVVRLITLLIGIANAAVVARHLGPEGKGIVAMAGLVPAVLGLVLSLGVGASNVYWVGSRQLSVKEAFGYSITFAALGTLLGFLTYGALRASGYIDVLVPGVSWQVGLLGMLLLPLNLLDDYTTSILQGLQRIRLINLIISVQTLIGFGSAAMLVVVLRWGTFGAVLASITGAVAGLCGKMMALRGNGAEFRPRWNLPYMRRVLSFGVKAQLSNLMQFFTYRLDTLILNYFHGAGAVGIYGAAVSIAELLWQLPNAVGFVLFPKAAATRAIVMNQWTPRVFKMTLLVTAACALGLALVGPYAIELVYSHAFISAVGPLLLLLPGVTLLGGGKVLTNEIAGRGYPEYNALGSGAGLLLTVLLDLALIPGMGALGAALASSISYAAVFLVAVVAYVAVRGRAGTDG